MPEGKDKRVTTVALYSNKGGVGKTAAAVNLSYLAAEAGSNTLVCDLDPQSSATYCFRVKPKLKRKAKRFGQVGTPIEKSIKGTDYVNLDLLPADFTHRNLDLAFDKLKQPKMQLRNVVDSLEDEYQLVMLDCPPSINVVAENIFNAADHLLVPLPPTALAVRAYRQLVSFLKKKRYRVNSVHVFFSMIDLGNGLHRQLARTVFNEFNSVLHTPIPYLPSVQQMDLRREPVPAFAPESAAARAYRNLWTEIQEKVL